MPRRLGGLLPEGVGGREGEGDYRESRFSMGVAMRGEGACLWQETGQGSV